MNLVIFTIYSFIKAHYFLLSIASGIIAEELLVFLSILSGKGSIPFLIVFLGGIIGLIFIDNVYYFLGKSKFIEWVKKRHLVSKKIELVPKFIRRFGEKNLLLELFVTKFVYGTRITAIMITGSKKVDYKKFLVSDIGAVLLWAMLIMPMAWASGKGINIFLRITNSLEKFLFAILVIVLFYVLCVRFILTPFLKRISEKKD